MDKANTLLRRSGVRLRSLGSSHTDLALVIAQLSDLKAASRSFTAAQSSTMGDLVKWSLRDDNRAVQDAVCQVGELFQLWAEVQKEFAEQIRDFRAHFERIHDGEKTLDAGRAAVEAAEGKESKAKKEHKRLNKKSDGVEEKREAAARVESAEREKDIAQAELYDRTREHEVVKMIRVKDGLLKFNRAYVDMAEKAGIIFQANGFIAQQIPDVRDEEMHDIKYSGTAVTMQTVIDTKERIKNFNRERTAAGSNRRSASLIEDVVVSPSVPGGASGVNQRRSLSRADLPPPYTEAPLPSNPFYESNNGVGVGGFVTPHNRSNVSNSSFTSPDMFSEQPPPPGSAGTGSDRIRSEQHQTTAVGRRDSNASNPFHEENNGNNEQNENLPNMMRELQFR